MATSNQKKLSMNRFNWNSKMTYLSPQVKIAVEILSESKMGVSCMSPRRGSLILGLPARIFCAIFTMKARITVFLFGVHSQGVGGFSRGT
jgi:hypothetical protein